MSKSRIWVPAAILLSLVGVLRADDQPKLPLDVLLETPIKTAAKYDQQLSRAAASVTVITAEEIERYGWTRLDEVLQSVRGFFITYDRQYAYAGVRGIGRPTDCNQRLMLLLDGVTLNDSFFGKGPIGGELPV